MSTSEWPPHTLQQAVERLPRQAKKKYRALVALIDDARALTGTAMERERAVESTAVDLEYRLSRCDPRIEAARIAELREELAEAHAEHQTLLASRNRRANLGRNSDQIKSQLDIFIPRLIETTATRVIDVKAELREGEDLKAAILRVRRDIGTAQGKLSAVRNAPMAADEIKAALEGEIDRLAKAGAPHIDFTSGQIKFFWPDAMQWVPNAAPAGAVGAMLCWAFPDMMARKLTAGIDHTGGIPAAERNRRIDALKAEILLLEHEEEALVVQALDAGLEVHRRPMASPFALLGLTPLTEAEIMGEPLPQAAE